MNIQDCMLLAVALSYKYVQKTQTNCSTWTLTQIDKTEKETFLTFDLILFHRHRVKHQITFFCYILWINTNAVRCIITCQDTSDSTAYDMRDRHNKWEVC